MSVASVSLPSIVANTTVAVNRAVTLTQIVKVHRVSRTVPLNLWPSLHVTHLMLTLMMSSFSFVAGGDIFTGATDSRMAPTSSVPTGKLARERTNREQQRERLRHRESWRGKSKQFPR